MFFKLTKLWICHNSKIKVKNFSIVLLTLFNKIYLLFENNVSLMKKTCIMKSINNKINNKNKSYTFFLGIKKDKSERKVCFLITLFWLESYIKY